MKPNDTMDDSEKRRRVSCFSLASSLISTCLENELDMSSSREKAMMGMSPLERLVEIQSQAEYYLRSAIMNERARRWEKVTDNYNALLKLIARPAMPPGFSINDSYVMLIYESYYHLGIALQNLDRHKDAVVAYTQAMKSVNIHKNGCLAGCNSNTCFQTPVLAKRSFAHARAGNIKNAFIDIEKAIVLDTRNPDLFCIRALLWNTNKDIEKAVDDLNRALRYNPCHVCALLLRGSIDQPFRMTFNFLDGLSLINNEKSMKKDHIKAQQINPQAVQYIDVTDIHSKKLIKLWNRFLWSLNVPRNIVHPELMEGFKNIQSDFTNRTKITRTKTMPVIRVNGIDTSKHSSNYIDPSRRLSLRPVSPFRCGTPASQRSSMYSKRRNSYGEAIRTYSSALKISADDFTKFTSLSRPQTAATIPTIKSRTSSPAPSPIPRPPSEKSKKRPSVTFSHPLLTVPTRSGAVSAPPSLLRPPSGRASLTSPGPPARRSSLAVVPITTLSLTSSPSVRSKRDAILGKRRSASEFAHQVHGLRVYETLNIRDAPRMYYKPWTGDKLPVADMRVRQSAGVFRV